VKLSYRALVAAASLAFLATVVFRLSFHNSAADERAELGTGGVLASLSDQADPGRLNDKHGPADHYYAMRSWPDGKFSLAAYTRGLEQARADYQAIRQTSTARGGGASWQLEGPKNIGGRINTIAVDPTDNDIIYVGCAAGGIFKTTDGGGNWAPIFDDQLFLPIGDIEIDPSNHNIIYAGTGDPNVSGYPFIGDGLYKSTDAGATWSYVGLAETRIISRVRVHPLDPNLIYVGAMGLPFEKDENRGLYKSTDGGGTWSRVLHISDSTGISDFLIDETDPDRVWAAGWDRLRNNFYTIVYGPGAVIRRTTDGGTSWSTLGGGLPTGFQCRIGMDQEPGNPNHILAQVIGTDLETQGVYESFNGGTSWLPYNVSGLNSSSAMGGFGWYFAKVRFNPFIPNQVWVCGVNLWRTANSGSSWTNMTPLGDVHADKHDLVFLSATEALLATDGGLYRTTTSGTSWTDIDDIPNTQFYHIQLNPHVIGDYWGGSQDNGTSRGSIASPGDWIRMFGGDGFHTEFNPDDPDIVFVETQNGDIWYSNDGAAGFDWISSSIPFLDRRNWSMPYILSPHDPSRVYAGTYRLHQAEGAFPIFSPLSGDLTKGVLTEPRFHNLTTIRESPVTEGLLYTGASDGRVSRSSDAGSSWSTIDAGLPNRYVTDLECSFQNEAVVFATHSGYKDNDFSPMVHHSNNRGASWTAIHGDLPALGINDLEVYPGNDSIVFVANDGGVYFTLNLGETWARLGSGMPVVNVYDIELDLRLGKLVAGTHARSMMSLELSDFIPSQLAPEVAGFAEVCAGESVPLLAAGAVGYSWSPALGLSCSDCPDPLASPSVTTTYTVTFNDGLGHTDTREITVQVNELPGVPTISQTGENLFAAGDFGSYQWFLEGVLIPGADNSIYVPTANGLYTVQVTSPAGCSNVSEPFSFNVIGLEQADNWTLNWGVSPNPFSDQIWISLPAVTASGTYSLRLYDARGRLMLETQKPAGRHKLDATDWAPGIYYLRADAFGRSQTVKLVRN